MKLPGVPRTSKWVTKDDKLDEDVDQWLQNVVATVDSTTQQVTTSSDSAVHVTVGPSNFPTSPNLPAGMYQVKYAMWVTQAATVNSSLTFTATWTNNAQTFSQSGAAMTGNTLTTQQNCAFIFRIDASTMVQYTLTYASAGATPMKFQYWLSLESIPS